MLIFKRWDKCLISAFSPLRGLFYIINSARIGAYKIIFMIMKNWRSGIIIGVVVLAVLIGAKFLPAPTNTTNSSAIKGDVVSEEGINKDDLAKHLTQIGTKMYGTPTCGACTYQKGLFGESWQYIDYVECSTPTGGQSEACLAAKITAYPTWEFPDGEKQIGVMTLAELAQRSDFN